MAPTEPLRPLNQPLRDSITTTAVGLRWLTRLSLLQWHSTRLYHLGAVGSMVAVGVTVGVFVALGSGVGVAARTVAVGVYAGGVAARVRACPQAAPAADPT